MTIHTLISVQCDCCTCVLGIDSCADKFGYYFNAERDALVAARSARWYVDARKILCPACWERAISQRSMPISIPPDKAG